jgi:hypothetical protein
MGGLLLDGCIFSHVEDRGFAPLATSGDKQGILTGIIA